MGDQTTEPLPFLHRAFWCENFAWTPKRSYLSGKWIWMTFAYEGIAYLGSGDTRREEIHWITQKEWLMETLKGRIN